MSKIDFSQVITAETRAAEAMAAARDAAEVQVLAMIDAATLAITGPVPLAEKLSWDAKERAARAFVADAADAADLALLEGEASVTGEKVAVLAPKIIRNADAYRVAAARLAGLRRLTIGALREADTVEAVEAAIHGLADHLAALQGA